MSSTNVTPTKPTKKKPAGIDLVFLRVLNGTLSQMAAAASDRAMFTALMSVCNCLEYGDNEQAVEYLKEYTERRSD